MKQFAMTAAAAAAVMMMNTQFAEEAAYEADIYVIRARPSGTAAARAAAEEANRYRKKWRKTGRNFQAKGRRKGLHSESCTVRGIRFNRTKDRKGRLNAVTGVERPFYFLRLVEIT